ncbi:MAG: hypothetical protein MAG451_02285 [Anaerolineales bacterium]|nr:hypothetical protein [Anaerolineales bacterium]
MQDAVLEGRVTNLEELMAQLLTTVDRVEHQIERTDRQIERTESNLDRLSNEMRDFKDEMRDFKDEMRDFKDEMGDFKDEMGDFKDEMGDFKDEARKSSREMSKKWGELSNKMGTMAEDLVAPSIERILRTTVGCPHDQVDFVTVRMRKRHPVSSHEQEFDVMAGCGEYLLINETKSRLDPEAVKDFADLLPQVHEFFPEHAGQQIIGAIASLYVDESLVRYGERLGLIVLGFGEDVMEVLNTPGFKPKSFKPQQPANVEKCGKMGSVGRPPHRPHFSALLNCEVCLS